MPEITVEEDNNSMSWENNIGFAWESGDVLPEAKT
jgi:hypothetical protein